MELFEHDYGVNSSPIDKTDVCQCMLFYSGEEIKEFKKLCKEGIRKEFPEDYKENGNISDFVLMVLRRHYGSSDKA